MMLTKSTDIVVKSTEAKSQNATLLFGSISLKILTIPSKVNMLETIPHQNVTTQRLSISNLD